MNGGFNLVQLLSAARYDLESGLHSSAPMKLHKVLFWSRDNPEMQLEAAELMARSCDSIGQHFFASEYMRYVDGVRSFLASQQNEGETLVHPRPHWEPRRPDLVMETINVAFAQN